MKKGFYNLQGICLGLLCMFLLIACSGSRNVKNTKQEEEKEYTVEVTTEPSETGMEDFSKEVVAEPEVIDVDWSGYFHGLNGAAVVYDVSERRYSVYNRELALARRPPCSTFKVISSLIALENGIIEPENSTRIWSGEIFWNENWNHDIDFHEAFRTSCVWYFRNVIDEVGYGLMQKELDQLQYGNRDISDWEGCLNLDNDNRALTGFWIESSLMISPKEQTEVMERIFGESTAYTDKTLNELKQVMLVTEQNDMDVSIYGKTGLGTVGGIVADAWFVGFADGPGRRIYYCVYLGRTDGMDVSSTIAKEIAIRIVSEYCRQ